MAVGEACKAIFWPTPGLKERTFDTSEVSASLPRMSASVALRWGECLKVFQRSAAVWQCQSPKKAVQAELTEIPCLCEEK